MNKKIKEFGLLAAIVGLLVLGLVAAGQSTDKTTEGRTVSVTGDYIYKTVPDEATIYIDIQSESKTATDAGTKNAETVKAVKAALVKAGVDKDNIETSYYYLTPKYQWQFGKSEIIGYQATHSLKVKITLIENVGKIIDAAVEAGATNANNIQFDLSESQRKKINEIVLKKAAEQAKNKAEILVKSLGSTLGDPVSIEENNYNYVPYYRYWGYALSEDSVSAGKAVATTQIEPKEVQVSASVKVSFEII